MFQLRLSLISRAGLFATPWAPLSRQEYCSGLPFPSQRIFTTPWGRCYQCPPFRIRGEAEYHMTKRCRSLDGPAGLWRQTRRSGTLNSHLTQGTASQPSPSGRRRRLRGIQRLTVRPNKESADGTKDSRSYQMLNSQKQLPVYTKPLAQFVMLSQVCSPYPPGKSG